MGTSLNLCNPTAAALLLLILLLLPTAHSQENATYSFSSFAESDKPKLTTLKDSYINHGALQLTPDTRNDDSFLVNKSGRVLLTKPFKLWEEASPPTSNSSSINTSTIPYKHVASFHTSFLINVFRDPNTVSGEGLTFLIVPTLDDPPPGSEGGYLGLTNQTQNGETSNHFVAIEFDTVKQSYDPDANHVGLDLNGVDSNTTVSLTPLGIEIAPVNPTNYTVWVDYDGAARHVWVYMAVEGKPKPAFSVLNASLDLSDYVSQYSYIGFSGSTGSTYELNCILAWNLTVEILPDDNDTPSWKWVLVIGLPVMAGFIIFGVLVFIYIRRKNVGVDPSVIVGTLKSLPGTPREFRFKDLKKATNNFDERLKLGQGGFGIVYKGVIPGEDTVVAVKKFSRENIKGQDDFLAELVIINRLRHKHLVPLVGWCHKKGVLLLVYEFMPNGSLDQHLFCGAERPLLTWDRRYNIITGVASALQYLHNEYNQKVVHRDLKASNVMLDSAFNARLGDFGLARALETDKTSYADIELGGVPGTMGYIAPECFHTGKATRESDVYGFGAVVLEVVCGRRPRCDVGGFMFLADWVWKLHREGRILEAVDPRLGGDYEEADAERLLLLGLACSHPTPGERPKTQAIVQIISRSVAPPWVAPFRPPFVWPSAASDAEGMTSTVVTSSSSFYASSNGGWTPQFLSREGVTGGGGGDISMG